VTGDTIRQPSYCKVLFSRCMAFLLRELRTDRIWEFVLPFCSEFSFVILCWRETWSIISRPRHGLRVFENRVERMEVACAWRKLCNEELHNLYSLASWRMRCAGHVACMREKINAC
jgi:hypothetical protein